MVDLATANGINVPLATLPPARTIFWSPDAQPATWIPRLNDFLRNLAASRGLGFVDYYAALTDGGDALQDRYSADGVHVSRAGYRVMTDLLRDAGASIS